MPGSTSPTRVPRVGRDGCDRVAPRPAGPLSPAARHRSHRLRGHPAQPGSPEAAADGGRQHHPGDEQRHLRRHLLGPPCVPHRRGRDRTSTRSCGRSTTTRPSSPGSRRSTEDAARWRTGPRPRRPDSRPNSSSGRGTSCSSSTSSAPWCNPTSIASRRVRPARLDGLGDELRGARRAAGGGVLHLVLRLLAHTRDPARTAAQAWPRITRFDDRWCWLLASVVPRFRRFAADTQLIDASLRRIADLSRVYASMPCIVPSSSGGIVVNCGVFASRALCV